MSNKYDLQTLLQAVLFNTCEVLPTDHQQLEEELKTLVEQANSSGETIRHYIGFEVSGQIHIGTGISSALKIKKLQDAGVECMIWIADYHTYLNNKLDGKLETIRQVAKDYFGPVMLECCRVVGCRVEDIKILYAQDLYETRRNDQTFWTFDMKIGKEITLSRVLKSISVMGKTAGNEVEFGTLRYPVMQVADAFFLQAHLVHSGLDQRKCHVLMRETAPKLDTDFGLKIGNQLVKPIAIHHNLLLGIEKKDLTDRESSKMSKSKPDSAIWVHDSLEEIQRKLKKAYCPMPNTSLSPEESAALQAMNPILDWCSNMLYPAGHSIAVIRPEKFGGNQDYASYEDLYRDYMAGKLHPLDLKNGVAKALFNMLEPIHRYSVTNPKPLEHLLNINK